MRKSKKEKKHRRYKHDMSKNYTAFCNNLNLEIHIWTRHWREVLVYDVGFLENSQQFKEITGVLVEHL